MPVRQPSAGRGTQPGDRSLRGTASRYARVGGYWEFRKVKTAMTRRCSSAEGGRPRVAMMFSKLPFAALKIRRLPCVSPALGRHHTGLHLRLGLVFPPYLPGFAIDRSNPTPRSLELCRRGPVFYDKAFQAGNSVVFDVPGTMVVHPDIERTGSWIIGRAGEHHTTLQARAHAQPRAAQRRVVIFKSCSWGVEERYSGGAVDPIHDTALTGDRQHVPSAGPVGCAVQRRRRSEIPVMLIVRDRLVKPVQMASGGVH